MHRHSTRKLNKIGGSNQTSKVGSDHRLQPSAAPSKKEHLDRLLAKVKKSKLKLTDARIAILKVLVDHHGPFTVDEIQHHVPKKTCDLATIYRTLTSLDAENIVRRCEFGDGVSRFELSEHGDAHHHHLICNKCKSIEIIDDCELEGLDRIAKKHGFTEVTHVLEFFGLCQKCTK